MGGDKDTHDLLEEAFCRWMIREQSVPVDEVQITLLGMREA